MFKYNRNPNYLGEIMIYSSFAFIASNLTGYFILAFIWLLVFLPNILVKDY
jgi:protein-S-isoprenylcysteine O-methyltransferase Ste14